MGYKIGLPCIKLNTAGTKTKKCGDLAKVSEEALSERNGLDGDIENSRTEQNEYLTDITSAKELIGYSSEHCSSLKDRSGRSIRNDAVKMIATVIKPPSDFMNTLSPERQTKFLHDAVDCLTNIIGKERIKAGVIHYDELVPHVHLFWEPMSEDGFLCAKEVFNLSMLSQINKEMPARLREKGWNDIDDCKMYDEYEVKEKINKQVEKYIKNHPEENITPEKRNELFKQFKSEDTKERRQKNGKTSFEFKNEQNKILDKKIEEKQSELKSIENKILSAKDEEKLGKKIAKAISEGKTSVSISTSLAEKLHNSVLNEEALQKKEQILLKEEQRIKYKNDEFEERVQKAVKETLPGEMEQFKNFKQKETEYQRQISQLKTENENLLEAFAVLLKEVLSKVLNKSVLPNNFIILGKEYGGLNVGEAAKEMIDTIKEQIKPKTKILYSLFRNSHH